MKKILCHLLLLKVILAAAQGNYQSTWYSADSNHLPQNSVKSVVQDKYGFIWLSTEGGLVRYDGENFKTYNTTNIPGLNSDRMYFFGGSVQRDSITVRNELGELVLIRGRKAVKLPLNRFTYLRGIDSHLETIHALYFTEPGRRFRLRSGKSTFIIGDSLIVADNGSRARSFAHRTAPGSRFFASGGHLYKVMADGTYVRFTGSRIITGRFPVQPAPGFRLYLNVAMDQVFIVSDKEVYLVKEVGGQLDMELLYNDFDTRNNILAMYYDSRNRLLYLGSSNKGLQVVQRQPFGQIASAEKHVAGTDGVFYALTPFEGKVLAATGDIFDPGHFRGRLGIGRFSDKYIVISDNKGDLWLKAFTDLFRARKSAGYKEADRWHMPNRITAMAKSRDGRIWTAVSNEGKEQYDGSLYVSDPDVNNGAPKLWMKLPDRPVTLRFDDTGLMWMGGRRGLYSVNVKTRKSQPVKGLSGVHVRTILPDKHDLWIGSYNKGLYLLRNGRIVPFPVDRNRYLLTAHCILDDHAGFLWITTNSGLFRVCKADLFSYAGGSAKNVFYYRYSKSSGFSTNEFNGGCEPCGAYLNNTAMFLPSMDGIVYFDPAKVSTAMPANDIFIDEVQVDLRHAATKDSMTLPRNFGRIRFYISSPFYGDRYNQNIDVMLEGPVSQEWLPLGENNISFSTLPPGYYTLTARKLTGFGSKFKYRQLVFFVPPAFWQTWWFYLCMALAGIAAVYLIIRMRIRYIRYRNKLLENQVAEQTSQLHTTISALRKSEQDLNRQVANHRSLIKTVTHDIKSPLKFMSITGRYIYNEIDKDPAAVKEDVESIYTASSQLYHFIDNFLEYSKERDNGNAAEPFQVAALAAEKIEFFKTIARSRNVRLINNVAPQILLRRNRHLVAIVLHNLIDNALKHTETGNITVSAGEWESMTCIAVADTGTGMNEEQVRYYRELLLQPDADTAPGAGLGLRIIAELLAIMGGTLELASAPGEGTTITVCFEAYSL